MDYETRTLKLGADATEVPKRLLITDWRALKDPRIAESTSATIGEAMSWSDFNRQRPTTEEGPWNRLVIVTDLWWANDLVTIGFETAWRDWVQAQEVQDGPLGWVVRQLDGSRLSFGSIDAPTGEVIIIDDDFFNEFGSTDAAWREIFTGHLPWHFDLDNWQTNSDEGTGVLDPLLPHLKNGEIGITTTPSDDRRDAIAEITLFGPKSSVQHWPRSFQVPRYYDSAGDLP